jgi:hypothetical protein
MAAFPDRDLMDESMRPGKLLLNRVLESHEPYPAWVAARGLRFLASNRGAETLFPGMCAMEPEAIIDLWYGPGPFGEMVENWPDVVWAGVARCVVREPGQPTRNSLRSFDAPKRISRRRRCLKTPRTPNYRLCALG